MQTVSRSFGPHDLSWRRPFSWKLAPEQLAADFGGAFSLEVAAMVAPWLVANLVLGVGFVARSRFLVNLGMTASVWWFALVFPFVSTAPHIFGWAGALGLTIIHCGVAMLLIVLIAARRPNVTALGIAFAVLCVLGASTLGVLYALGYPVALEGP